MKCIPGFEHDGLVKKVKSVPELQVNLSLPLLRGAESEHFTSRTVPACTGKSSVVSITLFHSFLNPVHSAKYMSV